MFLVFYFCDIVSSTLLLHVCFVLFTLDPSLLCGVASGEEFTLQKVQYNVICAESTVKRQTYLQCESKKFTTPNVLWQYFPNGSEILNKISHAYCTSISMQNYQILFGYL